MLIPLVQHDACSPHAAGFTETSLSMPDSSLCTVAQLPFNSDPSPFIHGKATCSDPACYQQHVTCSLRHEKDSNNRPDEELAAEAWHNYRQRNDSFIVDHFQLQNLAKGLACVHVMVLGEPCSSCHKAVPFSTC
eukprot:1156671-Pelagomonas_calceolata.AAC.9